MTGGLRRMGTVVRAATTPGSTVLFAYGSLGGPQGRQSEIKAETVATALGALGVNAVGLSAADGRLGRGTVEAIQRLSGGKLIASDFRQNDGWSQAKTAGPFRVYSAAGGSETLAEPLRATARRWAPPNQERAPQVLLLDGSESDARAWARRAPGLDLIVFRSGSRPPDRPLREGGTWLVTAGDKGKWVVQMTWSRAGMGRYSLTALGPEWKDDPAVARQYRTYLARVSGEGLLEQIPRRKTDPYAGSKACQTCHADSYDIWVKTEHAAALKTLEDDGHDRDPDCVSCHVVGLESTVGYISRKATPDLTDVGCESCHGPGKLHAQAPEIHRMPKLTPQSCMSCHNPAHSPGFDYHRYWEQIRHP